MPNAGGANLAGEFTMMLADVRKEIDAVRDELKGGVAELIGEIQSGRAAAKALRAEAATVRASFAQVLGNNPGASEDQGGERG